MTTDANLVGGENSAKTNEQTVDSSPQTATSAPQAPLSLYARLRAVLSDEELNSVVFSNPPATPPRSDITVKMEVSLLEKYGNSAARVLMFALDVQRDTYFDQMHSEIKGGDFSNAYSTHHDYTMTTQILNELTLCAIDLANQNLAAAEYFKDPKRYATSEAATEEQERDSYQRFLTQYCNQD